eukprot:TRINITY_DN14112_c0_g2_i2.p1 TRINITY_DN14112_c0_g2~~TRINITY_DN14112_c0_g2_i2.p1  ORF type:complete len:212 (-),score=59.81 TRINITY_DN14112_c0_g2_i2:679-1221(-)
MLRSLVGSEMCIRDSINAEYGGNQHAQPRTLAEPTCKSMANPALMSVEQQYADAAYSGFVEAPVNQSFYQEYLHFSFLEQLLPLLQAASHRPQRVLDLGCGNGVLSRKLLRACPEIKVVGVDVSAAMLQEAARLREAEQISPEVLELVCCDISALSSAKLGTFDVLISGFLLAHASSREG